MRIPSESIIYVKKAVEIYLAESAKFKRKHDRSDVLNCFKDLSTQLHSETSNQLALSQAAIDFDSPTRLKAMSL